MLSLWMVTRHPWKSLGTRPIKVRAAPASSGQSATIKSTQYGKAAFFIGKRMVAASIVLKFDVSTGLLSLSLKFIAADCNGAKEQKSGKQGQQQKGSKDDPDSKLEQA